MAKPKKQKGPLIPGFPDKFAQKLPGGSTGPFVVAVDTMDLDAMKGEMLVCERAIDECEGDMEQDAALAQAKSDVKTLAGAYRDTLGCQKAKIKYLIYVMKQRGY